MNKTMKLPSDWKFESSRKIYSNKYIELYEDVLDIRNKKKIYTRAKRNDYSTIVPFVSDNEILVIKSYRHLVNSYQIEAPSGYIENGETPFEAANRELKEETGYGANNIISLDIGYFFTVMTSINICSWCRGLFPLVINICSPPED